MSDTPNIRIEGNQSLGRRYIGRARGMLRRLREVLSHRGVESGGDHGRLDDGVYCYVRAAGDVSTILIVADEKSPEIPSFGDVVKIRYPDFLSGWVITGIIQGKSLYDFKPTEPCADLHKLSTGLQSSKRLSVDIYPALDTGLGSESPIQYSQYAKLRPGMYSGTMCKLVQFLMGYGRINLKKSIYDKKIKAESPNDFIPPETKFQKDIKKDGVQIRYDYRFARTHGLVKGANNRWWLCEIAQGRGIHLMPLKRYPETTTESFRKKLEDIGDNDGLDILDLFGGFPTGETIPPITTTLEAYVRAGLIIKVVSASQLNDFYSCSAYSSACGWAFSESGKEAHNTAYRYGEDGVQRGVHWNATFSAGEIEDYDPPDNVKQLKRKIAAKASQYKDIIEPLFLKCDRLSDSQVSSLLDEVGDELIPALDALVLSPIAAVSGSVGKAHEGVLFWPGREGPQFKFYEPLMGELVSHDFRPAEGYQSSGNINCNTIMYVFFSGEELKYVRFYNGVGESISETSYTEPDDGCKFVGEWSTIIRSGDTSVYPFFYTSDIDHREEFSETESIIKSNGTDMGFTSVRFGDNPERPWECFVFRTKAFQIKTELKGFSGRSKEACIATPSHDRQVYFYFERDIIKGELFTRNYSLQYLDDPIRYTGWRKFITIQTHPAGCGEDTNRRIWEEYYDPYQCSEYATEGSWASACQQIEPMAYSIILTLPPNIFINREVSNTIKAYFVSSGDQGVIKTHEKTYTDETDGDNAQYIGDGLFIATPKDGLSQFLRFNRNFLGSANTILYWKLINDPINQVYGTPLPPDVENTNLTFIGVVNG